MTALNRRRELPLPPSEDFVVAESAGEEEEDLTLALPDGKTPEEAHEELTGLPGFFEPGHTIGPDERTFSPLRFTLFELFAATTFLCLEAGVANWFPLQISVGVLGLCTLVVLLAIVFFAEPASRLTKLALATLVLSYVVGAIVSSVKLFIG